MKIIVLHGDDTKKSFERLEKFVEAAKQRLWEVSYLDNGESIREELSSPSLFGSERFYILRDIKLFGKEEMIWINKNFESLAGNLIIYHEGELGKTFLKALPKSIKIEEFKLPVLLWNFLDGIYPGNPAKNVKQFHQLIETEPPEFIFTLISKLFRDLYWVKVGASNLPYQPWRVSKLKAQSSKFNLNQLKKIIEKLSEIDIEVKTSKADLVSSLDLLLLKLLE